MAKDYEDKIEDILEKEEIESSEMEVEVDEEMDMSKLGGESASSFTSHEVDSPTISETSSDDDDELAFFKSLAED